MGVIDKSGSWYSFGEEKIGQGRDNAKQFLKDHFGIARQIEKRIREASNSLRTSSLDESLVQSVVAG